MKAADLLSTKYRAELCAAVMLGQGKNVWQVSLLSSPTFSLSLSHPIKYRLRLMQPWKHATFFVSMLNMLRISIPCSPLRTGLFLFLFSFHFLFLIFPSLASEFGTEQNTDLWKGLCWPYLPSTLLPLLLTFMLPPVLWAMFLSGSLLPPGKYRFISFIDIVLFFVFFFLFSYFLTLFFSHFFWQYSRLSCDL